MAAPAQHDGGGACASGGCGAALGGGVPGLRGRDSECGQRDAVSGAVAGRPGRSGEAAPRPVSRCTRSEAAPCRHGQSAYLLEVHACHSCEKGRILKGAGNAIADTRVATPRSGGAACP